VPPGGGTGTERLPDDAADLFKRLAPKP